MGYYTRYSLTVKEGNTDLLEKFIEENENAAYALDSYGETKQECKWYSHDEELVRFTKENKDVLFELSGEGEESGDIWKKYFMNGRMQVCKATLTFPDYDYSKLK